ncbi:VOC family protein [Caenimonas soli]|uniref:VOC family protein n=1 Tax=Caenimonas soli TaxID=2735555 RepID=UPI0015549C34|nr:VOC family protein [Caenimonas soli]
MKPACRIDHLVVAARTLDQGVQWCEATLGVTPRAGGEHPLMGTHNRLLLIATAQYPRAYLEIIAINPAAPAPGRRRWFDLDDPALQHAVQQQPRLVHFVASTGDAGAGLRALRRLGIERGPLVQAERATPEGMLRWQISVRRDGQRLFYGGLPTLIQWGDAHPADAMPDAGLALQSLHVCHPRLPDLQAAHSAIGLQGVGADQGAPNLVATLATPKGAVVLESAGT